MNYPHNTGAAYRQQYLNLMRGHLGQGGQFTLSDEQATFQTGLMTPTPAAGQDAPVPPRPDWWNDPQYQELLRRSARPGYPYYPYWGNGGGITPPGTYPTSATGAQPYPPPKKEEKGSIWPWLLGGGALLLILAGERQRRRRPTRRRGRRARR
jgi:hypothetical protein